MQLLSRLTFLTVYLAALSCSTSDSGDEIGELTHPELRSELLSMAEADQSLRQDLSPERLQDTLLLIEMLASQAANANRMVEILDQFGWPGADLVGVDGAAAAWLLVQHGQASLQERALDLMRVAADPGVSAADIAMMTDRILVERGQPQLYGTQFQFIDGKLVQDAVDDPDSVEVRRAEVGLPTMAEYVRMLEETYGVGR